MEQDILRGWLALLRMPGIGKAGLKPLIQGLQDPNELFAQPPAGLTGRLQQAIRTPDWALADQDMAWLEQTGTHLIPLSSSDYPARLAAIPDPPPALFLRGKPQALQMPQIAMVGSRNPTSGGVRTAREFAAYLAARGIAITSGLALGIDTACHRGALDADGVTLAVTGTGLDRVYPAKNRELAHKIAESGALVSEFPPGTAPTPGNFPRRNRVISGLSIGTLVIEAALQSGSLITARQAGEQGREVFAIPGSIHNPLAKGCHALIRQGAKLVEEANDILEELLPVLQDSLIAGDPRETEDVEVASAGMDPEYLELIDAMGYDPVSVDSLVARTSMAAESVSSMLLLLELEGHVSSVPGGMFTYTGKPIS